MNIEGTINKAINGLTKNADKLAMLYAVLKDPLGDGRTLNDLPTFIFDRLGNWKIPDNIDFYIHELKTNPFYAGPLKQAIMAYLLGYGLNAVGQNKWGNLAKSVGGGLLKGTLVATALWLPALNPHGSIHSNFANAPTKTSYEY